MSSQSFNLSSIGDNVSEALKNNYVKATLAIVVILYGSLAAPALPSRMNVLFSNPWFRLVVLASIAYLAHNDLKSALIVSVVFLLVMNTLSCKSLESQLADYVRGVPVVGNAILPPRKKSSKQKKVVVPVQVQAYPVENNQVQIETAGDEGLYLDPSPVGGCGLYDDITKVGTLGGEVGGYDKVDRNYRLN